MEERHHFGKTTPSINYQQSPSLLCSFVTLLSRPFVAILPPHSSAAPSPSTPDKRMSIVCNNFIKRQCNTLRPGLNYSVTRDGPRGCEVTATGRKEGRKEAGDFWEWVEFNRTLLPEEDQITLQPLLDTQRIVLGWLLNWESIPRGWGEWLSDYSLVIISAFKEELLNMRDPRDYYSPQFFLLKMYSPFRRIPRWDYLLKIT